MKLNSKLSTTRNLWQTNERNILNHLEEFKTLKDQFETILFLPKTVSQKGKGGLRTKGYFKSLNSQKPLITIITVVYNNQKDIEETILSVINQSYDNIEYLIIDGGSEDNTVDIIKKYDNSIDYWISEKDNGIYDAMNKGCRLATGAGLCFLNSGDKFVGDVFNNRLKLPFLIPCKIKENEKKILDKNLLDGKSGMPTSHQAMVFLNKRLLYNLKYKISSDYDFFIRHGVFLNINLDNPGYVLYDNKGMSKKNFLLRDYETILILYKYYGLYASIVFLITQILKFFKKLLSK
ncbi:glycosyltransferase [Candidatus Pelagibacter ubique]|nr:glycosyltransferase [Candidatus Pelagibacter ubique]